MANTDNGRETHQQRSIPGWLKVLIPLLALGGLGAVGVLVAVVAFVVTAWFGTPLPVFGFGDGPDQPIPFPHTVHADTPESGGLGIDCTFCHRTVTREAAAGIPSREICSFCHRVAGSPAKTALFGLRFAPTDLESQFGGLSDAEVLAKLRSDYGATPATEHAMLDALKTVGLGGDLGTIDWQRVHRLPDHTRFVHEAHIAYLTARPEAIRNNPDPVRLADGTTPASQVCSTCHGDVKTMQKVKQVEPLKMGQCVNCHRDNGAPVECATCHY